MLLIGDRAMKVPDAPFHAVVDLAEAWQRADRACRSCSRSGWSAAGVDLGDLPEALARSRAEGLAHADELAPTHGPRLGLDVATCYDYLTRVLSYDLGEPRDRRACAGSPRWRPRLGLAPEGVDLVFHRRRDLAARR